MNKKLQLNEIFLNIPLKIQTQKIKDDEQTQLLIIPYLKSFQKNELPSAILSRLETRLSGWNEAGTRTQSMGLLRMKKIKRHTKFSILVNDDNINSLQIFQKLQYNSNFQIHYGQSFTNSLDIFRNFLENGFNYDVIFIDLKGKTMNGFELMKNIRGIEKLTNSTSSKIIGILTDKSDEVKPEEKGIDQFIVRPFDEKIIMNIINNIIGTDLKI